MINLELWLAFVAASSVLLLVPGPTILSVIAYSISEGKQARGPLLAAVALGDTTAIVVSLLGLGLLLQSSLFLFQTIKIVGGLYVLYLGIRLLKEGLARTQPALDVRSDSSHRIFLNTYLVTALNPKGIVFFVAFLPIFVDPDLTIMPQLLVLGITFVLLAMVNCLLYLWLILRARTQLMHPSMQAQLKTGGGVLMSAAGIWALFRD